MLSDSRDSSTGFPSPALFAALTPSKDPPADGRSNTRKDGSRGFSTSSRALPDDFRRVKVFGILIGIEFDF